MSNLTYANKIQKVHHCLDIECWWEKPLIWFKDVVARFVFRECSYLPRPGQFNCPTFLLALVYALHCSVRSAFVTFPCANTTTSRSYPLPRTILLGGTGNKIATKVPHFPYSYNFRLGTPLTDRMPGAFPISGPRFISCQ